jgi:branched-chain amino acid aminotransferase
MQVRIERSSKSSPKPAPEGLGFGKYFTDHMFRAQYDAERKWHNFAVVPRQALALDPASSVLHYGQAIFEGSKAYKHKDGGVRLFRPVAHARRFMASAQRLCLPEVPEDLFLKACHALTRVDIDAVPTAADTALYLRPTLIGTEGFLGVRPSTTAEFFVIASPVGAYWAGGRRPLRIWTETDLVRAAPGGAGAAKFAGNYAASLLAAKRASGQGYDQVLWTDARDHLEVEEIGTMNVFVQIGDTVITPPLGGTILAGVTRDCTLTLLREWGVKVEERALRFSELVDAEKAGTLKEMFGTGTAAVIAPIGKVGHKGGEITVGKGGEEGALTTKLYETIRGIQYGEVEDRHNWLTPVAD